MIGDGWRYVESFRDQGELKPRVRDRELGESFSEEQVVAGGGDADLEVMCLSGSAIEVC